MEKRFLRKIADKFRKGISDEFVKDSEHFCIAPWVHFHVTQMGTATPCCQTPWGEDQAYGHLRDQSIEEIWNGKNIREFRKKMLKDQFDSRCTKCYEKDKVGVWSLRKSLNTQYSHHIEKIKETRTDGSVSGINPVYLDIRFSNLCNFRCRICGPESSSRWFDEGKKLGRIPSNAKRVTAALDNYADFLDQIKPFIHELEEIYFAGGEPLIMEEHYAFLDLLEASGKYDVLLRYNTNFSVFEYKGRSIFDRWKKFGKVKVFASLDDSGKRGELQRKDQVWPEVIENIRRMKDECPHVHVALSPTISVFNAGHITDFHREWTEAGYIDVKDCWPNQLEEPREYNMKVLPRKMREEFSENFIQHADWIETQPTEDEFVRGLVAQEYRNLAHSMLSDNLEELQPKLREQILALDELRGERTTEIIPELQFLFQDRT